MGTNMSDGEKLFLGVVLFLVLKGLLDPKDAHDRKRVREAYRRHKGKKSPEKEPLPLFDWM